MEIELNISKTSIYRILTEHLGLLTTKIASTLVTDYFTKNHILTINHSLYSPDTAPCDFFLSGKMHLHMKGKRHADVEVIQKTCTGILAAIPANELKHSFDKLLDRANSSVEAEGDYLIIKKIGLAEKPIYFGTHLV